MSSYNPVQCTMYTCKNMFRSWSIRNSIRESVEVHYKSSVCTLLKLLQKQRRKKGGASKLKQADDTDWPSVLAFSIQNTTTDETAWPPYLDHFSQNTPRLVTAHWPWRSRGAVRRPAEYCSRCVCVCDWSENNINRIVWRETTDVTVRKWGRRRGGGRGLDLRLLRTLLLLRFLVFGLREWWHAEFLVLLLVRLLRWTTSVAARFLRRGNLQKQTNM